MTTRVDSFSLSDCELSVTAVARRLRVLLAACWVRSATFCIISPVSVRSPEEEALDDAQPVLVEVADEVPDERTPISDLSLPKTASFRAPRMPGFATPIPAEPAVCADCSAVADDEISENPCCASRATAEVTSLIERLRSTLALSASSCSVTSSLEARTRRVQSTSAMRVLSPGASASECSSWPSARPCWNQLWR